MSYNIDTFQLKRLENLVIPLAALKKHARKDWWPQDPKIIDPATMTAEIEGGCGQTITGILKGEHIHVTKLDLAGEGSGTYWNWIIEPALKESKGILEFVAVWEGGDHVNRVTVNDGEVKDEPINL